MYHSSPWVYMEENLENSLRRNSGVERAGVLFDAGPFTWLCYVCLQADRPLLSCDGETAGLETKRL